MSETTNQKVTSRQLSVILFLTSISMKVMMFPSLASQYAGNGLYLSSLIGFLFEFITLFAVIKIINLNPKKNFFEILVDTYGKFFTYLILTGYTIYYFTKCVLFLISIRLFFQQNLYEVFPWYMFLIPLVILVFFIASKKDYVLARVFEVFLPIILMGMFILMVIAMFDVNFNAIQPFAEEGFPLIMKGIYKNIFWYGDVVLLLGFCSRVKVDKKLNKRLVSALSISTIIITVFMLIYYCIYENISGFARYAIAAIVQFSPRVSNMGRIDWLAICVWSIAILLQFILIISVMKYQIIDSFKLKENSNIYVYITLPAVVIISAILNFNAELIVRIIQSDGMVILGIMVQYVIPIITAILLIIKNKVRSKKNNAINKNKNITY